MTPTFRKAGRPAFLNRAVPAFRKSGLPLLWLCTSALAGCAGHTPPPEISYDNAAPAVQTSDPPAPVRVVELPKPLPLPGQLKPLGKDGKPEPEPADPATRVNQANAAARVQPVRNGFINSMQVYPFVDGRSPTSRFSPASSSSAPVPSPPATRCAGSSAIPRAALARRSRSISS